MQEELSSPLLRAGAEGTPVYSSLLILTRFVFLSIELSNLCILWLAPNVNTIVIYKDRREPSDRLSLWIWLQNVERLRGDSSLEFKHKVTAQSDLVRAPDF